eukprot:gene6446-6218_t
MFNGPAFTPNSSVCSTGQPPETWLVDPNRRVLYTALADMQMCVHTVQRHADTLLGCPKQHAP